MQNAVDDVGLIDLEIFVGHSKVRGEYRIMRRREEPMPSADAGECLALLEDALVIELQLLRRDLFFVHAAAMQQDQGVVLLSGESGSGKSSLAWALSRRGFRYFSDELAPIDVDGMIVWPFPRALRLKAEPPQPDGLPSTFLDTEEAFCIPAELLPGGIGKTPSPVSTVFFLQRPQPTPHPTVTPLSPAKAVANLTANTLNLLAHPDYGVDHATRIVRNARCFELVAADLEATCGLIRSILATS
jgi:hypothetical protein